MNKSERMKMLAEKCITLEKRQREIRDKLKTVNIPESKSERSNLEENICINGITPLMKSKLNKDSDTNFEHIKLPPQPKTDVKDEAFYLNEAKQLLEGVEKWRPRQRKQILPDRQDDSVMSNKRQTKYPETPREEFSIHLTSVHPDVDPAVKRTNPVPALAGLRVIRGPTWRYGDVDGGEGHVGTVQHNRDKEGHVNVVWDNGNSGVYSVTEDSELLVVDPGPAGVCHGIYCDSCRVEIIGFRWRCLHCYYYNMCTLCYGCNLHDETHNFERFDGIIDSTLVGTRNVVDREQAMGAYIGATVKKADTVTWKRIQIDGSSGVIEKNGYLKIATGIASYIQVRWKEGDKDLVQNCGLGWRGMVDVIVTKPAEGIWYYKRHLPRLTDDLQKKMSVWTSPLQLDQSPDAATLLGLAMVKQFGAFLLAQNMLSEPNPMPETTEEMRSAMKKFSAGDIVRFTTKETITAMTSLIINRCGVVVVIANDGKVWSCFGNYIYCLKQEDLQKETMVPAEKQHSHYGKMVFNLYQPGDLVYICEDEERVKRLQVGHGEWQPGMNMALGRIGVITTMLSMTDDVLVVIGTMAVAFRINIELLVPQSICFPDYEKELSIHTPQEDDPLNVGDVVSIIDDREKVFELQNSWPGGWTPLIRRYFSRYGIVEEINQTDDTEQVAVLFGDRSWIMHPDAIQKDRVMDHPHPQEKRKTFQTGLLIKLDFQKKEQIPKKQEDHGGWRESMNLLRNKVGIVRGYDEVTGNLLARIGNQDYLFNEEVVRITSGVKSGTMDKPQTQKTSRRSHGRRQKTVDPPKKKVSQKPGEAFDFKETSKKLTDTDDEDVDRRLKFAFEAFKKVFKSGMDQSETGISEKGKHDKPSLTLPVQETSPPDFWKKGFSSYGTPSIIGDPPFLEPRLIPEGQEDEGSNL